MPTTPEQIADLISGYTDLKGYFENNRSNIDANVAQMNSRVEAKETEVDKFIHDALPETRFEQTFTIGGSTDFYYPAWWTFPNNNFGVGKITISRRHHTNGGESERPLDNERPHQAALLLEMEGNSRGWGGDANFMQIKRFSERYNHTSSHPSFRMFSRAEAYDELPLYAGANENLSAQNPIYSGVYLRGGGLSYRITKNWTGNVQYHDGNAPDRQELNRSQQGDWSARWFVNPIPIADRLAPIGTTNAYVYPGI